MKNQSREDQEASWRILTFRSFEQYSPDEESSPESERKGNFAEFGRDCRLRWVDQTVSVIFKMFLASHACDHFGKASQHKAKICQVPRREDVERPKAIVVRYPRLE